MQSPRNTAVVDPAGAHRQETPVPVKPASNRPPAVAQEKTKQTPAKSTPVSPGPADGTQTSSKPGKDLQGQALSSEGRQDNTTKPSAVRKENPKAEATPVEVKDVASPGPKAAGGAMPEIRVAPSGDAAAGAPRSAVQTQSQAAIDAPAVRSPVQSVGEQILDSVHAAAARGDRQVLVRLTPPELGTVVVRFQEQGNYLSGTLEVANREVRRELEQALPQVVRALQEAGVQVRRIEIIASDQPERGLGGEHQPQDVWQQHQGTGQDREQTAGAPQVRWPQAAGGHNAVRPGSAEDEPRVAAPGRIDVLL